MLYEVITRTLEHYRSQGFQCQVVAAQHGDGLPSRGGGQDELMQEA